MVDALGQHDPQASRRDAGVQLRRTWHGAVLTRHRQLLVQTFEDRFDRSIATDVCAPLALGWRSFVGAFGLWRGHLKGFSRVLRRASYDSNGRAPSSSATSAHSERSLKVALALPYRQFMESRVPNTMR